jgi:hypothetical protein
LKRFEECGTGAWVLRGKTDHSKVKLAANLCRDKLCVPCQADRARIIRRNLEPWVKDRFLRFITLTLRSSASPLKEQLERLYRAWKTLRLKSSLAGHFKGGVAALEVKWNPFTKPNPEGRLGHWHPHLHVVCEGKYIDQRELSRVWLRITGDTFVVDIRKVGSPQRMAEYITKYVTKLPKTDSLRTLGLIREYAEALASVRCINSWGTWRKLGLLAENDSEDWEFYASLNNVMTCAQEGCPTNTALLHALIANLDLHWSEHRKHSENEHGPP